MFDFVLHKTQNITILSKHIASGGRSFAQSRLFRFTTGNYFLLYAAANRTLTFSCRRSFWLILTLIVMCVIFS